MHISNKLKAMMVLFAAIIATGFAFAAEKEWVNLFEGSVQGAAYDQTFAQEVTGDFTNLQAGDILKVTYTNAGDVEYGARAASPLRGMNNGDIALFASENENLSERETVTGDGEWQYTFVEDDIAKVKASGKLIVSARNLVITKVELFTEKKDEPLPEPAEGYIKNPTFAGTPVSSGICTYAKDMEANNTTYSQMQPVPYWEFGVENGDARASGIFAIGSDAWLGGPGYIPPTAGPNGETEGNLLGIVAVWTGTAQYVTEEVTLAAGTYTLSFPVYNSVGGTTTPAKGLFGFIANDGTEFLAPASAYTVGQWQTETISFSVSEETTGRFSLGYTMTNVGSGSAPHLFIGTLKLDFTEDPLAGIKAELEAEIANAQDLLADESMTEGRSDLQAAITEAQNVLNNSTDATELQAAIDTLKAAEDAFIEANKPAMPEPSTDIADGVYYIYNVGTQKYLAAGADWGTHAIVNAEGLDIAMALQDGTYILDTKVSNGGESHFLNGEYTDGAAFGWTLYYNNGYFNISDGTKYLTAGDDGKVVLSDDANAAAAQWEFYTFDDRLAELNYATPESPVDATFLIQDANFNRNDQRVSSWTMVANNKNLSGGNNTNNCAESYHSTFTLSQVLANAPAGKYQMTIQGFYRQDDEVVEEAPVFYANEKTAELPVKTGEENSMSTASESFTNGLYTTEPIEVTVASTGALTIGVRGTAVHQWVIWDNFRLTYLGNQIDLSELIDAYNAALDAARAALADETVTGEERGVLESVIAANENVEQTQDALTAAIAALNEATNNYNAAKASYQALADAKALVADLSFPYASAEKKAAAEAAANAVATSAADATAKKDELIKAYRQYAESSALLEGVSTATNMTDYIVNPNAEQDIAEPWFVTLGEGSGGSLGIRSDESFTDGDGNANYRYFDGGNWGATSWDVTQSQEIFLPKGKYLLTVTSRASADLSSFNLFAGDQKAEMTHIGAAGGLFDRGWNDASIEFQIEEDGYITIGVQGVTSAQYQWMSFTRFRLVQFTSDVVVDSRNWIVFTEPATAGNLAEQYTNEAGDFILTYTDTDNKITIDANNAWFGDAEKQDKFTHRMKPGGKSSSKNNLTLTIPTAGKLLVYARSASSSATDRNVVLTQNGTELYNAVVQDADAIEVDMGGENPTKVYPVISADVVAGTVDVTYPTGAINFYGFELLGVTEGIGEVTTTHTNNGVVYNLRGQRVITPAKGLYIINGKKVVLK